MSIVIGSDKLAADSLVLLVCWLSVIPPKTVFSLNFSSAGEGPFMDGKAKNIYFSKRGEGGQWSEGRGPAHCEIFYSHILRPILRKSPVVIFRQRYL